MSGVSLRASLSVPQRVVVIDCLLVSDDVLVELVSAMLGSVAKLACWILCTEEERSSSIFLSDAFSLWGKRRHSIVSCLSPPKGFMLLGLSNRVRVEE